MVPGRLEDRPIKTVGCKWCNFETVKENDLYRHLQRYHDMEDNIARKSLGFALQKNEAKNKEYFSEITNGLMVLKRPLSGESDRPPTSRYDTNGQSVYSIAEVDSISSDGDAFGTIITTIPRHGKGVFIPKNDVVKMHLKKGTLFTLTTHTTTRSNLLACNIAPLLPYKSSGDFVFPKPRGRERDRRQEAPTTPKRTSSEQQRPPPVSEYFTKEEAPLCFTATSF
jgi:hypothetical protein